MEQIWASLAAFFLAAGLLTITPGLDTAFVLRTAAAEGPRPAIIGALGVVLGCLVWAVAVAAGLGVLLTVSRLAYDILRWAGAAYLVWLGIRMIASPRRSFPIEGQAASSAASAFARGALNNLLNPKVGVFYISFLPQFVPAGVEGPPFMLLLGVIHAVQGLAWFACLILATRPITAQLRRPKVLATLDRLTGGVFVAFGVALAARAHPVAR